MIIVTINAQVFPAKRREFLHTVRELTCLVRKMQGCQSFRVYRDLESKNVFCLLEKWENQADVEQHIRSPAFGALLGAMKLLTESSNIKLSTVSHTAGMEQIQAAREH